jgi:hypothetical protein
MRYMNIQLQGLVKQCFSWQPSTSLEQPYFTGVGGYLTEPAHRTAASSFQCMGRHSGVLQP